MMRRPSSPEVAASRSAESGFTLIEVLVALTVMVLLFSVLFGALRISNRYQEKAESTAEMATEFQTTHRLLRRLLTRAYPLTYSDGNNRRYAFIGTPSSLRFVTLMTAYPGQPGPHMFSFEITGSREGDELRVLRKPFLPGADSFDAIGFEEEIVLVKGLVGGEFAYFGTDGIDPEGSWRSSWDEYNNMPDLVRIRLAPDPASGQAWPDLIIPVVINMDIECAIPAENTSRETQPGKCRLSQEEEGS